MLKTIKGVLVDTLITIMLFGIFLVILAKCVHKETDYTPIQQPVRTYEQEETDELREVQRTTEFWTMMIPAL